jgi:hypothetical protein
MKRITISALSAALLLSGPVHAAIPLDNLSFESGLGDWWVATIDNLGAVTTVGAVATGATTVGGVNVAPVDGSAMAQMTNANAGDVLLLKQAPYPMLGTLATGLTLWYRLVTTSATPGNDDSLTVRWRDTSATWNSMVLNASNLGGSGDSGWRSWSLAPNTVTGLYFTYSADHSNQSWAFVDLATAVPEPGEWAMLLATFGLVGSFVRRRRNGGK